MPMPPKPRNGKTPRKPDTPMSKADTKKPPVSLNCAVLTISDTRDTGNDTSGDYLAESLLAAGHRCGKRAISQGNLYQIRKVVSDWIADDSIQIILTNGGTGFSPNKSTAAPLKHGRAPRREKGW